MNTQRAILSLSPNLQCIVLTLAGMIVVVSGCRQEQQVGDGKVTPDPKLKKTADSTTPKIVGAKACKFCHASEYLAWQQSTHANLRVKIGDYSGSVQRYAEDLKLSEDDIVSKSNRCVRCHGTAQSTGPGTFQIISGVSCESCHGGAGGEDGWLSRHVVTHDAGDPPDQPESFAHYRQRVNDCESQGMIRSANLYNIAKNCYSCHFVSDEGLVNVGHPAWHNSGSEDPKFEIVTWSGGEVRHNFHLQLRHNADAPSLWKQRTHRTAANRRRFAFVIGQLVELEVCLHNLASVTEGNESGDFASKNQERLEEHLLVSLQEIAALLGDAAPVQLITCVSAAQTVLEADDRSQVAKTQVVVVQQAARALATAVPGIWLKRMAAHSAVYDFELMFAMIGNETSGRKKTAGVRGAEFLITRLRNLQSAIRNAMLVPEDDEEREALREKLMVLRLEEWMGSVDGVQEQEGNEAAELMGAAIEAAAAVTEEEDPMEAFAIVAESLDAMTKISDLKTFEGVQERIDTWVSEESGLRGIPYQRP